MEHGKAILEEVGRAIVGKGDVVARVLQVVLARGHVLMEDIPGVGKTTLALAFSKVLGLSWGRVQFTPDVMPSDIGGYAIYQKDTGKMVYQPGAVFCNLFLADELNRATSRTQSALLEAMEEGQVTVDGVTRPLPQPFVVIATQNPAGASGTQPLPDSQMDRFMARLTMGYPQPHQEAHMVRQRQGENPLHALAQITTITQLEEMRQAVDQVHLADVLLDYMVALVSATRSHKLLAQGASPRATLALAAMSRAGAYLAGRDYVTPQDVLDAFPVVVSHRLTFTPQAQAGGAQMERVVATIGQAVPQPPTA